ncbi:MAG: hypothetical protein ABEJ84_00460 [Halodesulfurarchaeum sp.]
MTEIAEPSEWLFDGSEPGRDLPPAEAEEVAALSLTYDEPICTTLPESAVEAVRELFRGFYAHTPYRRIAAVERVDEETIAVYGETRSSASGADDWEPHLHTQDVDDLQTLLIEYFGPLWRVRRREPPLDRSGEAGGAVEISRVVGRRFHYPGAEGDRQ